MEVCKPLLTFLMLKLFKIIYDHMAFRYFSVLNFLLTLYLLQVLVGHPDYEVVGGSVEFKGQNLLDMDPEERSHGGLFMSFQSPVEIPGVSNIDFLQMACNARRKKRGLPEFSPIEVCVLIINLSR